MTSKKNTHTSHLAPLVKKIGARAVKIVTKAADGGEWTVNAIAQAATWLETGSKEGGLQRAWPQLAAQLRTIVKNAGPGAIEAPTPDESTPAAEPAPVAATRAPRRPRATKPLPPAVEPHTEVGVATARGGTTLRDLKRQFLEHLEAIGKSRGTVFSYELDLGVAERHFGPDRTIETVTEEEVEAYYASDAVAKRRDGTPKNAITTAKLKRVFRQAIEFAVREGLIAKSPIPVEAKAEARVEDDAPLATSAT